MLQLIKLHQVIGQNNLSTEFAGTKPVEFEVPVPAGVASCGQTGAV